MSVCPTGKRCLMTRGAAEMTRDAMLYGKRQMKDKATRERLEPYQCRACGFWHLGKRPMETRAS